MTRSEEPQKPGETKNRANKKRQKLEDKSQARKPKAKKLDWKTFFPPIPPKKTHKIHITLWPNANHPTPFCTKPSRRLKDVAVPGADFRVQPGQLQVILADGWMLGFGDMVMRTKP
jgi:hypothetical protein